MCPIQNKSPGLSLYRCGQEGVQRLPTRTATNRPQTTWSAFDHVAPQLRETGTPHILAQRSRRSLWNTALLDIEQISSYYKNKYKGLMLQRITLARQHYACDTMLALCQQRNNSQQRKSSSNGTTTKVVNSTPQGPWLGHDLARTRGNLDKQTINQGITCNLV